MSSGPPFTSHLIGGLLHERTGVPWIADFRDPWTHAPFYPERPAMMRRIDQRLERWTARTATRTIAVNRGILEDLAARHGPLDRERLVTIPNGYDEADFEGLPRTDPGRLTIVHSGSLFASRDPVALREALADLCATEPGFAEEVEVHLAGRNDAEVEEAFSRPPLDRIVRTPGYLPHDQSLALLRSAHLCLLLVGIERMNTGMLTGKIFEYLGSGTPILAFAPEGEASELIRRSRAGFVLDPRDRDGAKALLRDLWRRYRLGERRFAEPDPEVVASYSRRRLAERLAGILDEITAGVAGPAGA
jgi:glycosyltransferase involved in cell wall biosynthesis